jgi:hypothetical protein
VTVSPVGTIDAGGSAEGSETPKLSSSSSAATQLMSGASFSDSVTLSLLSIERLRISKFLVVLFHFFDVP